MRKLQGAWPLQQADTLTHSQGKSMLTQSELKSLLHYCPSTGVFTWLVSRGKAKSGSVACSFDKDGYIQIVIKHVRYRAHRLAWFYVHGTFPPKFIDHINSNRSDNRICNLRLATNSENLCNRGMQSDNKSGFKGVSWQKDRKKWVAQCKVNSKKYNLGRFDTAEEASLAYQEFASKAHGEFFNRGVIL
jgi:hypothetical protein